MAQLNDMLVFLRKREGLSQQELANKLKISRSTIGMYETGKREPDLETLEALADFYNVDMNTLTGNNPVSPAKGLYSPTTTDEIATFYIQTSVAAHYNAISTDETLDGETVEVPTSYLNGRPSEDYCAMRVKGNSMYPQFHDGDIVIVLKQGTLDHSGQVGVICYGGEQMTIKRINYVDGEDWLELIPLNSEFPPERIEGADLEQCKVIGLPRILIRNL